MNGPAGFAGDGDVAQAGRVTIERGGGHAKVLDLDRFPPQGARVYGRELGGCGGRPPGGEDVWRKDGIVEHDRSWARRELTRALGRAGHQPHGEPPAAELAEDTRRLPGVSDVVLQRSGHCVAVHLENGCEHDDRSRPVVANRRRERPPVLTAREAAVAQAKRLPRDLERICTHDEHALVQRGAGCLEQRSEEHTSELQSPYDLVWRLLLEKKKYGASSMYSQNKRNNSGHFTDSAKSM